MYLPPLQPANHAELYQSGDVTVDPSAVIGLGVILQASPQARIVIGAGACLGMGTIINACEGTIEIEAGAVLGPGVLIVGQGKVGANATIGAVSTIFNASISPMQVLAAGSVIDHSQAQVLAEANNSPTPPESKVNPASSAVQTVEPTQSSLPVEESTSQPAETTNDESSQKTKPTVADGSSQQTKETKESENNDAATDSVPPPGTPIYGQIYISRMLGTIFPQGKPINRRP